MSGDTSSRQTVTADSHNFWRLTSGALHHSRGEPEFREMENARRHWDVHDICPARYALEIPHIEVLLGVICDEMMINGADFDSDRLGV